MVSRGFGVSIFLPFLSKRNEMKMQPESHSHFYSTYVYTYIRVCVCVVRTF